MPRFLFIIISFLILSLAVLQAQDNPFLNKDRPAEEAPVVKTETQTTNYPVFIQQMLSALNGFQRELNSSLSGLIRKISEEHDPGTLFSLLLIAFIYGVVHALGPGHGKIIMTSYAISNPLKARHGITLGVLISIVHTLSAIMLVVTIFFLLKVSFLNHSVEPKKVITLISYGLFMLIGVYLLIKGVLAFRNKQLACACSNQPALTKDTRLAHLFLPALAIGIIPGEGTILLLVFSISIEALWIGILLSVVMSLGMAVTISLIGLAAIGSRSGGLKLMSGKKEPHRLMSFILETAGSVLIILIGLVFFFSSLNG